MVGLLIVVRTPANLQTSKKLEYDWLPPLSDSRMKKTFLNEQNEKQIPILKLKKGFLLDYTGLNNGEETIYLKLHQFEWPARRQFRLKSNTNLECAKAGIGFERRIGRRCSKTWVPWTRASREKEEGDPIAGVLPTQQPAFTFASSVGD